MKQKKFLKKRWLTKSLKNQCNRDLLAFKEMLSDEKQLFKFLKKSIERDGFWKGSTTKRIKNDSDYYTSETEDYEEGNDNRFYFTDLGDFLDLLYKQWLTEAIEIIDELIANKRSWYLDNNGYIVIDLKAIYGARIVNEDGEEESNLLFHEQKVLTGLLEKANYFTVHSTCIKKATVRLHQIVNFLSIGRVYRKFSLEIKCQEKEAQHLDGNPWNNHFSNLAVIPAQTNFAIAKLVKGGKITVSKYCQKIFDDSVSAIESRYGSVLYFSRNQESTKTFYFQASEETKHNMESVRIMTNNNISQEVLSRHEAKEQKLRTDVESLKQAYYRQAAIAERDQKLKKAKSNTIPLVSKTHFVKLCPQSHMATNGKLFLAIHLEQYEAYINQPGNSRAKILSIEKQRLAIEKYVNDFFTVALK